MCFGLAAHQGFRVVAASVGSYALAEPDAIGSGAERNAGGRVEERSFEARELLGSRTLKRGLTAAGRVAFGTTRYSVKGAWSRSLERGTRIGTAKGRSGQTRLLFSEARSLLNYRI